MTALRIEIDKKIAVSGILQVPEKAAACCVIAHGSGAGMTHPFMVAVAKGLADGKLPRCATSSPTWSAARSAQMRQLWRKPRSERQ